MARKAGVAASAVSTDGNAAAPDGTPAETAPAVNGGEPTAVTETINAEAPKGPKKRGRKPGSTKKADAPQVGERRSSRLAGKVSAAPETKKGTPAAKKPSNRGRKRKAAEVTEEKKDTKDIKEGETIAEGEPPAKQAKPSSTASQKPASKPSSKPSSKAAKPPSKKPASRGPAVQTENKENGAASIPETIQEETPAQVAAASA